MRARSSFDKVDPIEWGESTQALIAQRSLAQRSLARSEQPTSALPTIAIIGGGFSGAMVAIHLLRTATSPLQIKLIERRTQLGGGLAYSTPQACHLLNVPADKISAFADDPNHFLRWLHDSVDRSLPATAFVPRRYYGQYVQSLLQAAIDNASPQVRLEQITDEVVSLRQRGSQLELLLRHAGRQFADQVVLALGNPPPQTPAIAEPSFYHSPRYIASAGLHQSLSHLRSDGAVLLIGSGLTAVDAVLTLRQQGHRGAIHLVSRRGLLPRSHQIIPAQTTGTQPLNGLDWHSLNLASLTIRGLLNWVRQQVNQANAAGQDWRSVLDALRPQVQTLWQNLPLVEKQRFLRHVRPYWDVHRHRMAPAIAQQITTLMQEGAVFLHAARMQSCCEDATGVTVTIRHRGSAVLDTLHVQAVVNCTGPAGNYRQSCHPLIMNLLAAGLTRTDSLDLGLDVMPDGALMAADGTPSAQLYTLGCLKRGLLWETTAVSEIRSQARALAEQLLLNTTATVLK